MDYHLAIIQDVGRMLFMKTIIVGLGNPGEKYQQTRHNLGFLFLDYLTQKYQFDQFSLKSKLQAELSVNSDFALVKPQTFMNLSGEPISKTLNFFGDSDATVMQLAQKYLLVAHDDLDIKFGEFKIQYGKGPKDHNGLASIYQYLSTADFWHIRIGSDDREGNRQIPSEKYVLQKLDSSQLIMLEKIFEEIVVQLKNREILVSLL